MKISNFLELAACNQGGSHDGIAADYETASIVMLQGIRIDIKRLTDDKYCVKKICEILESRDTPCDSASVEWRVQAVGVLEDFLRTKFYNTREFRQKTSRYLEGYDLRQGELKDRLKKARNKAGLTQSELAKSLGLKSHVPIAQYESGQRYPSKEVLAWLETQSM
jgi:DNA-binding XRE family transcriptional regulator